jgi:hypothetical protein
MPSGKATRRTARTAATLALATLAALAPGFTPGVLVATAAQAEPSDSPGAARRPFASRDASGMRRGPARAEGQGGGSWWLGTAGVALALAVAGWASVAAKRFVPKAGAGAVGLRVVGRTNLSPKHTVYLLQAGDRVLIVGTGHQGPPSLLGEMTGGGSPAVESEPGPLRDSQGKRLDVRLGDES